MKCVICKFSQIEEGKITVALQRGETVVIIKDVPANICKNCGEYYLNEIATNRVFA